ncbi:MAG TPA: hypothetical protein VEL31_21025 [Ktedonobacteraceae bacterium]|nr:hypothetical protein [Ktedonobacteraceae bacterium]
MSHGDADREEICQGGCLRGKAVSAMVEAASYTWEDKGDEHG